MTAKILANGDVEMFQGDDIEFHFIGVPTDDDYDVFIEIQDENRVPIAKQVQVKSNYLDKVDIHLTGNYTKLMTVPADEKYKNYYYGVKYCSESRGIEQTFLLPNKKIGDLNVIKVVPQAVEGI